VLADITSGKYFGEIAFTAMVKKLLQVRKKKERLICVVRTIYLLLIFLILKKEKIFRT
jgi:hypothetical protein